MKRTTIYLDDARLADLRRLAQESGASMAELIRAAIDDLVDRRREAPRPTFGLFASGHRDTARRAEEVLAAEGFGTES